MKKGAYLIIALGSLALFFSVTKLSVNQSWSLPYKYFLVLKGVQARKEEFVSIVGHRVAYIPQNLSFVKRLIGVPGDRIEIKGNRCFVNDTYVGVIRQKTKQGHPLSPLVSQQIPPGFVFVAGETWDSYDSRYEEFGLVRREHLQGKALPLTKGFS